MRHLITLYDLQAAEIERIFSIAEDLKNKYQRGLREPLLPGRVIALLFEKPSLRTRVSFEAGIAHLGGNSIFLGADAGFGKRESLADFGRVLSEYVDVMVVRSRRHEVLTQLADVANCSVVNGLTDQAHPCQVMADLFTLREITDKRATPKVAFVGDANNVAMSLAIGCARLRYPFALAAPLGYRFEQPFLNQLRDDCPGAEITVTDDPAVAVRDAAAVYTDVWASMGQEGQRDQRKQAFAPFQVNAELMSQAPDDACFMHCLPARRGEEVTDEVIDGPQSVVVQQAANRLHVQKAILAWLLAAKA